MSDPEGKDPEVTGQQPQAEDLARKNIRLAVGLGVFALLLYIGFFFLYG